MQEKVLNGVLSNTEIIEVINFTDIYLSCLACIDLIERGNGCIINLLHEETLIPKGNDSNLLGKIKNNFRTHAHIG